MKCCWSASSNSRAALWGVAAHPENQLHYVLLGRIQQLSCIMCCCAHPENHLPRWVPPHAPLARGSVDGATKMAAPSTQPPSGRPSEQGRRGRCFSTCHLAAHSASLCRSLCITLHNVGNEFGFAPLLLVSAINRYIFTLRYPGWQIFSLS